MQWSSWRILNKHLRKDSKIYFLVFILSFFLIKTLHQAMLTTALQIRFYYDKCHVTKTESSQMLLISVKHCHKMINISGLWDSVVMRPQVFFPPLLLNKWFSSSPCILPLWSSTEKKLMQRPKSAPEKLHCVRIRFIHKYE